MDLGTEDAAMANLRLAFGQNLTVRTGEQNLARLEREVAKLKSNLKILSFTQLVFVIGYKGFLKDIETCNGPLTRNMRDVTDLAWLKFLEQEFLKWKTEHSSEETKKSVLGKGCEQRQITSAGIEEFWAQKAAEELNPKVEENIMTQIRATKDEWEDDEDVDMDQAVSGKSGPSIKNSLSTTEFVQLVHSIKFRGYLGNVESVNGKGKVQRGAAEAGWRKMVRELFSVWATDSKSHGYDKEKELRDALDQVNGHGKFEPEIYWESDKSNAVRSKEDIRKARKKSAAKKALKNKAKANTTQGGIAKRVTMTRSQRIMEKNLSKKAVSALESMISNMGINDS
ncbi:uncharacterized protein LY89DRAFT_665032 [Mollisia scopiformis]|uniref:Uncharacterized protein n=1 Tax=Mollisia scopiformis TaxID=149040 RepID=A0A194XP68_MOLSC|nr:uncharacterized protein LY89DRAFT_665032 [Mollisia scopiformis]KUJ21874.1 hypothetical protein LY89DRAFT_665032 [Mollisia scopiformis]